MPPKKIENLSFEATLDELENIVVQLEQGDLELDKALTQFERGIGLARSGQSKLQSAQQKVDILLNNTPDGTLSSFNQSMED
ncbi:exodeoxyribonuclease VII small subunit [Psychrobium sp. 1_MG-2023]|uniref:exodeoxyribonuclease VII small subunit n=1 Tax=Psychrobium sp. 1_MG-2023 TaxID=3062624 RepID=UPI000C3219BF|nr:exodeoxyribonuclease VII small subunit [Psychrobium sp. 1_MG-2023]MDP2560049.1 exodeoxyribonuclease VII small subunit [Psychrobium sp. 1_MG-2023]PKF56290.1 exodeoxyribonuclease VII small subunit [Alteromonadales bacterium alter-6D02]